MALLEVKNITKSFGKNEVLKGISFSLEKGEMLATARCAAKVAEKRKARADKKVKEAEQQVREAVEYLAQMSRYRESAEAELLSATTRVNHILENWVE